jgi:S-(hydroxymethyl)glutathione dehydrogenase/alcohol dehydrogenase
MRAVNASLTIEDVDLDTPGPGEVVVRVVAAGLCQSDLHYIDGWYQVSMPVVLGHESAGIVEEVGENVTYVAPGDHVITFIATSCGECLYCLEGNSHLCMNRDIAGQRRSDESPRLSFDGEPVTQFLNLSSFAERLLVSERAVVKVTKDIPLDKAALLGCGAATGLGAVFNTARVEEGQTVAVIGCGGVGLAAVQGARIAGAEKVIAIDVVAGKLELAKTLGATHAINAGENDPVLRALAMTDGLGVHHAIEALGSKGTIETAFNMLRWGGTATVIGLVPKNTVLDIPGDQLYHEKKLQGSNMGSSDFRRDIPRYIEWYLDGRLMLDEMVTSRLTLDQINDGFETMRQGLSARSIVVFEE